MSFSSAFEKTAMKPSTVKHVAEQSHRLGGGRTGRQAASELADQYRMFKARLGPIKPAVKDIEKKFPKLSAPTPGMLNQIAGHTKALSSAASRKLPGPMGGMKNMSKPTRITPSMLPGNPVNGLRGLTGAPAQMPFQRAMNRFGTTARKGLVSRTAASRGPQ